MNIDQKDIEQYLFEVKEAVEKDRGKSQRYNIEPYCNGFFGDPAE